MMVLLFVLFWGVYVLLVQSGHHCICGHMQICSKEKLHRLTRRADCSSGEHEASATALSALYLDLSEHVNISHTS